MKMRITIVFFANIVAVVVVIIAIYSLKSQRTGLEIVLPRYMTFDPEQTKAADKSTLVNLVDAISNQYQHTEEIFQKALKNSSNIIFILTGTLIIEVFVLSFLVFSGRKKIKISEISD